jgi:hypothetical protein
MVRFHLNATNTTLPTLHNVAEAYQKYNPKQEYNNLYRLLCYFWFSVKEVDNFLHYVNTTLNTQHGSGQM